jgi:hypothetical protein
VTANSSGLLLTEAPCYGVSHVRQGDRVRVQGAPVRGLGTPALPAWRRPGRMTPLRKGFET